MRMPAFCNELDSGRWLLDLIESKATAKGSFTMVIQPPSVFGPGGCTNLQNRIRRPDRWMDGAGECELANLQLCGVLFLGFCWGPLPLAELAEVLSGVEGGVSGLEARVGGGPGRGR